MSSKTLFWFFMITFFLFLPSLSSAATNQAVQASTMTLQPTACVVGTFVDSGDEWWSNVSLKLTNQCGKSIDLQNSLVTFNDNENINTSFWGEFSPLSYPDNNLQITSQPAGNVYLASLTLHFPEQDWANTQLPNGQAITLQYGVPASHYDPNSVKVYLNGQPVEVGELDITNSTAKPEGVDQDPWVTIQSIPSQQTVNDLPGQQTVNRVQVPWDGGKKQVTGLAPGNYTIQPENVIDSQNNSYQGTAVPNTVTLTANQTVNSTVSYAKEVQDGKIIVQVQPLPQQLSGYTNNPNVVLTKIDTGGTITKVTPWGAATLVDQLVNNAGYRFSTDIINFNSYKCTPTFNPMELTTNQNTPTTQLTYNCDQIKEDNVSLNVSGLTSTPSVDVTLTPNDGSEIITKTIDLSNGKGIESVKLTDGVVFNVSATLVNGYTASFSPQPLTATPNAVEKITYQKQQASGGKIISYLPTWKPLPNAQALSNAGYTHMMVAFGLFSTKNPGEIIIDGITKDYIDSLHSVGIKALLSLGGASSSNPNATVNFHEVLSKAQSPEKFQSDFVASLKNLMTVYGFDGFDVDIEQGLGVGGTFASPSPTSDIGVLASIIKQIHTEVPNILITLTPQTANIAATSGYDATWGNYAALVMQTYNELSWVGIQLYNTGCTYGINQVCYANTGGNDPTYSVAMATDLLEDWPQTLDDGRATGFQPYISYLRPDQVVLGYPAPNSTGVSDGLPVTTTTGIKKAIECLRTASDGCTPTGPNGYTPPKAYPTIGGVFNWEVTYDQDNNFKFANDLKACVMSGNCN